MENCNPMKNPHSDYYDLYVAFDQPVIRNGKYHPYHWFLILSPNESTNRCTYYHVNGKPGQGSAVKYEPLVEYPRLLNCHPALSPTLQVGNKTLISRIHISDLEFARSLVESVEPMRCQEYVVAVLKKFEERYIVAAGITETFRAKIVPSLYEQLKREGKCPDTLKGLRNVAIMEGLNGLKEKLCCY
ncbi:hypothetical protein BDW59DRAFT_156681 [Aspergillus cavernicola]|uniref:Uncharacterized protein n=1 Tax=Aspergillus cavernicola TaxID=176166 RepID=A0ABR4J1M4_9EURO